MIKRKKHLIIALIILAGLCILYGIISLTGKKNSFSKEEMFAVNDRTDIKSIRIEPKGKEPFVILIDKNTQGKRSLWIQGYQSSFAFNIPLLVKLVSGLERLKAYKMLEDEPKNNGINETSSTVVICFEDKTTLTLRFGNDTLVAGRTYVAAEEKGCIYVIRKDIADICSRSVYAFRKPQLLADEFSQRGNLSFVRIEIDRGDGTHIVIRPQTAEEAENSSSDSPSFYVIEEPVFMECSDGKIDSLILTPILALEKKAVVIEDFPEDLAAYGLAGDGASLRLSVNDAVCKIILGEETEDGYLYAMQEGRPSVIKIPKIALTLMSLEWFDLIRTSLWMRSIDKLSSFTVLAPGKKYEMVLTRDKNGKISGGLMNGISVKESVVREIYMKLLSIHIEGRSPSNQITNSSEYNITLHRLDGKDESMEFAPVDARTYAIKNKGESLGFYTGISGIQELCRSLGDLE